MHAISATCTGLIARGGKEDLVLCEEVQLADTEEARS